MVFSAYQLTKEPTVLIREMNTVTTRFVCVQALCDNSVCGSWCPGTCLAGELMKTSVVNPGQTSTSVTSEVVIDSQTLSFLPSWNRMRLRFYVLLNLWVVLLIRAQLLRGFRKGFKLHTSWCYFWHLAFIKHFRSSPLTKGREEVWNNCCRASEYICTIYREF